MVNQINKAENMRHSRIIWYSFAQYIHGNEKIVL